MGGVVNAVTKPVNTVTGKLGSVAGAPIGGFTSGVAEQMPQYRAQQLSINKDAFDIDNARNLQLAFDQRSQQNYIGADNARSGQQDALNQALAARAQAQNARGQQQVSRDQQQAFLQQLQAQAAGQGPSLAGAQLKAAQDRSLKQQLAIAAAQRGGSPAALQRSLLRSQAAQNQQLAQDAAQARIQEQLNAQQMLGQGLVQVREQDLGLISADQALRGQDLAQLQQQQQLELERSNLANQQLAQAANIAQARQQAAAAYENLAVNQNLQAQGINASSATAANQAGAAVTGGLFQGIGSAVGALAGKGGSDKNMKQNIKSYSDKDSKTNKKEDKNNPKSFLDALKAYSFEYKDSHKNLPIGGKDRYLGVMAQDLEKAGPTGKSMVIDTPQGKVVDYGKGFGAILASSANLNERLSKLEKGYGKVAEAKRKLKKDK